ncbi:hypothetical protein FCV25MIE_19515 [Fagus crenata]
MVGAVLGYLELKEQIRSTWSSISRWIGSDQTTIIGHLSHRRSEPSAESKQDLSHRRSVRTDPVRGFCCAPFFRPDLSTPPLQTHAVKDATPLMVKTHGSKDPVRFGDSERERFVGF